MKIHDEDEFRCELDTLVMNCTTDLYYSGIVEEIYDDVKNDVECCADENYSDTDIKLAIGRVLHKRLSIIDN